MTLTKAHLIDVLSETNGFPKTNSAVIVETLIEIIKSKLASKEGVLISGFGKFCVKKNGKRRGRNSVTGEDLMLDARRVVMFKCSGKLRVRMNKSQ